MFYLPIRSYLHTPSSFDSAADAFGLLAEFLGLMILIGPIWLGLLLILVGSVVEERKRRAEFKRVERESKPTEKR